ncbi:type II toxin-antitoxin system HipA family toxin [Flavobacterium turcicum]|uniref:HipA domain-containing protein n=1 Tax=Flavobacterium turcicum TaxID=2764718 RepID=A0ABR7JES0_9FLAO|nr:HipA domain-containing protein [Flavobacterium turcicum]MBC5862853.1 HipA domain-containing protein [Flavobacterium turcicum]NHL01585.1 HipA domain-containing protein [Flavobacterium turcicum]
MNLPEIKYCPGTLVEGFDTYSRTCLNRVFDGKKVRHFLPYDSPASNEETDTLFEENRKRMSISGVQEKFSVLLEKNKLRLINEGERGSYILKPIPGAGKKPNQMPANEHLTMQIARQVYGIETAENALIFFKNGAPAYITKRFDVNEDGTKMGQEDFASLAGRTPQTFGEHYKYLGNYLELFELMQKYLPVYKLEAPKLLKILLFNYLFSNGDAHFKNFSLLETAQGDYRLSPAYDLLNSRIHIEDKDFALEDGLLPKNLGQGKISKQFSVLSDLAGISEKNFKEILNLMLSKSEMVEKLINASYLDDTTKRNYLQSYQGRLKQLMKE